MPLNSQISELLKKATDDDIGRQMALDEIVKKIQVDPEEILTFPATQYAQALQQILSHSKELVKIISGFHFGLSEALELIEDGQASAGIDLMRSVHIDPIAHSIEMADGSESCCDDCDDKEMCQCGSGDIQYCNISQRYYCNECDAWGPVNYGSKCDALTDWNKMMKSVEEANQKPTPVPMDLTICNDEEHVFKLIETPISTYDSLRCEKCDTNIYLIDLEDIEIPESEIRVDIYRGETRLETHIRLQHLPSGIFVIADLESSRRKNKIVAMARLKMLVKRWRVRTEVSFYTGKKKYQVTIEQEME